jgi:hypothetical protein
MSRRRVLVRVGIGLAWGVVMLAVFAGIVFGAMVGGGYAGYVWAPRLDGGHDIGPVLALAALAGIAAGIAVCHRARGWVQRLRLSRCDVRTSARVVWRDRRFTASARGPGGTRYTVYLSWRDPAGEQAGERQYRFMGHGPQDFASRVAVDGTVPIRYPAGRPHRFIIDVPYAPTMADQFI